MRTTVTIQTIKPARAKELLENLFEGQRNMREGQIVRLAEDMRLGRFRLGPDALVICKGKTANGQHRLAAVIRSGLAQKFLVMETDDAELYEVLDCGIGRTVGDVLGFENANQIAAIARMVCAYDKGLVLASGGGSMSRLNRLDIVKYAELHAEELRQAMVLVRPLQTKSRLVSITVMGALMMIGRRKHPEKTEAFVSAVFKGTDPNSAPWLFRERMIREAGSARKSPSSYRLGLALKALKAYISGDKLVVLKLLQSEEFPQL